MPYSSMRFGVYKQEFVALWWSDQHTTTTPNVLQVSLRMWSSIFVRVNPPLIIRVIFSFLQQFNNVGVSSLGPLPSCVLQLSCQKKIK